MTFTYYGQLDRVIDGDTIALYFLDMGLNVAFRGLRVRLAGINAPELTTPAGIEARAYLAGLVPPGANLRIESKRWDKYAMRIDADVFTVEAATSLNEQMLTAGHALPYP